jgi:hypothetical protein
MLLALLVAISNGSFGDRLAAAHAVLIWRSDFRGVTRATAAQYISLLKVQLLLAGGYHMQPPARIPSHI